MKTCFSLLLFICFICGCGQSVKQTEPDRIRMEPVVLVTDSMETMFPGGLYVTENFILWTNPFKSDFFVHVLDKESGQEVAKMIRIGEGPDEFISPSLAVLPDDRVMVYSSQGRSAVFSIPKVVKNEDPVISRQTLEISYGDRFLFTDKEEMIWFDMLSDLPFVMTKDGHTTRFGKYPVEGVEEPVVYFQGTVVYESSLQKLVYTPFVFPYYAVYERKGDSFVLQKEWLNTTSYDVVEGKLRYNEPVRGPLTMALTPEYIVTVERDTKYDQTDERTVGRDFSKLSTTIFLYDYDLKLKKIVNLEKPIVRIATDPSGKTLYIVAVEEEFIILKYDL